MSDEIRIYHVDDPNDAPERRLASLPALNPFIPTSLPQYVIPPVANSLYNAMQYYWYTAYQQGFAAQQQQQQLRLQQRHQQQQHQQQQVEQALHSVSTINQQHVEDSSLPTNQPSSNNRRQPSPQQTLCSVSSITSPSSLSPQQVSSSSSSSPQHHHSTNDVTTNNNYHHLNIKHQRPQQVASSTSSDDQLFSTAQLQHQLATTDHLHSPINNRLHSHHHHHHSYHQHHPQHHDQHIQLLSPISDGQPPTLETREPSSQHQNSNHQHIKKPLNPFMIYMQKQRPEIVKQGIIKESAAINQLLGQQWRKLSREEQEPYYKLAEQEKRMHAQKYPGWSARDNYANQKKRKKMRLRAISMNGATNCVDLSDKKCRARFGLSNMASWCKPCKRKKRCIYSLPKSSRNRSSIEQ